MKRILIAVGAATLLVISIAAAGIGFLGTKALMSADSNKDAAVSYMKQISKNWSVDGRHDIVDVSLVRNAQAPRVINFMRRMGRLGELVSAKDVSQIKYHISNTEGTTATIKFRGIFKNGTADVIAKLRKSDGRMKLFGIKFQNGKLKRVKREQAA